MAGIVDSHGGQGQSIATTGKSVLFLASTGGVGGPVASLDTLLQSLDVRDPTIVGPWGDVARRRLPLLDGRSLVEQITKPRGLVGIRSAAQELRSVLGRTEPDVIFANGLSELGLAFLGGADLRRTVTWVHNSEIPRIARLAQIRSASGRFELSLHAVSAWSSGMCVGAGLARAVGVIPNPIATSPAALCRGRSETFRVGYLGTAKEIKGFDLLPEIAALGRDSGISLHLFTKGRHRLTTTWRKLDALSNVHVHGPSSDVSKAYASCDAVLVPSRLESFCRVAAEAMAHGLPVIGSDLPPIRELLGSDNHGILFRPGDPQAAFEAAAKLASDPAAARSMGEAGRKFVERFAPGRVAKRWADVIEGV